MQSIHSIEGILFRSYLTGYNLSLLHKFIKAGDNNFEDDLFRKAAFAHSDFDFERKASYAKEKTERAMKMLNVLGINIIAHFEKEYPCQLKTLKDFPPLLFVKGTLPHIPCAAVVGSRQTSPLADAKTNFITKALINHGYGIVSGLALGIDTMAHKAALQYKGYTAAVVPTSLDRIYPSENINLSKAILEHGAALVSEQAPFMNPVANPFVLRNRIQSAFSDWIIPVEMGKESGTMHTLQYAEKQNKKIILCLPGPDEIDHHLSHYEGIIIAAQKFKKKRNPNILFTRNLHLIPELLKSDQRNSQRQLF